MNTLDYWKECLAEAADEIGGISEQQFTYLAEQAQKGHDKIIERVATEFSNWTWQLSENMRAEKFLVDNTTGK